MKQVTSVDVKASTLNIGAYLSRVEEFRQAVELAKDGALYQLIKSNMLSRATEATEREDEERDTSFSSPESSVVSQNSGGNLGHGQSNSAAVRAEDSGTLVSSCRCRKCI